MSCVLTHLTWNQSLIVGYFLYMVMIATETVQESSTRSFLEKKKKRVDEIG